MTNYYPLTAAQKMHHNWIMDYGTQQVSGVSVVASVQAELAFGLLKKCIQMETERSGCTRIRFTKPDKDGNVEQYLVKQDPRDIGFKDLSGMGSLAKAQSFDKETPASAYITPSPRHLSSDKPFASLKTTPRKPLSDTSILLPFPMIYGFISLSRQADISAERASMLLGIITSSAGPPVLNDV